MHSEGRLVEKADVVQHNMRYDAAQRLGVDYESLKKINPKLIYCHTRGFETGPRQSLPGNDQTGGCLAGVQYEDGGMARGGKPLWSFCSLGDTGNGFLSAIAIIQALYESRGNRYKAAAMLGIARSSLYRKIDAFGIQYEGKSAFSASSFSWAA